MRCAGEAASANDYACQGIEASGGHCYAVVEEKSTEVNTNRFALVGGGRAALAGGAGGG
jgi:hypothetical protein